jgi:hypothetical protein
VLSVFITQQTCYLSVSKLVQVVLILYLSFRLINYCIFNVAGQFQSGWNNRTYFFWKDDLIPEGLNLTTGFSESAGTIRSLGLEWKQPEKFSRATERGLRG